MRSLKKVMSIVLAVAMMLSMVSMVSFAAGEDVTLKVVADKASVKNGDVVTLSVYIEGAANGCGMATWSIPYDTTAFEYVDGSVTSTLGRNTASVDGGKIKMMSLAGGEDLTAAVQTVQLTAIKNVEDAEEITFSFEGIQVCDIDTADYTVTPVSAVVSIVPSFTIGYVAPVAIDSQVIGVTAEEIIALLPTKVTAKKDEAAENGVEVPVNAWASEDFVANKVGTYTFTTTTNPDEESAASGSFPIEVEVNVKPLVAVDTTSFDGKKVELKQKLVEGEVDTYTEEEFAAKVAELITDATITVAKDGIEDTYNTPAAVVGDITNQEVGTEIDVTYTLEGASAEGSFDLAEAKAIVVKVVMAANEIKDGSFTWNVNDIDPTTSTTLKINGAYAAKYAGKTVAVTLSYGEDGTKTFEYTLDELAQDAEEGEYEITLGTLSAVSKTIAAEDVIKVEVTVDNVVAYYGEVAYAELTVINTATKKPGAGISGGIAGPVVAPKDEPTEEPKEEPTDEPTEEPTEEPTDEPSEAPVTGTPVAGFTDVTTDHWAAEYIGAMKELGIVSGKSETSFEPEANITRAEFVKMIAVLADLELGEADVAFADCGADEWYTVYVAACVKAGYVNGISETEFGANDMITREDICAILGRALDIPAADDAAFTDAADIADYAKAAVNALAGAKVLNGYEDGSFAPKANATRAEVCKIVSSLIAYAAENEATEEAAPVEEEVTEEVVEETTEEVVEETVEEVVEETTEEAVEEEAAEEVVEETTEEVVTDEK